MRYDTTAYRKQIDSYPKCGCGQGLWAEVSRKRGHCEACELANTATQQAESET